MNDSRPIALKARYLFPVTGPPIPDGVVSIQDGSIVAVGENLSGGPPLDLGNVALLPGLVNAHTHLEFSGLENPLGQPGMSLPEWIRLVVAHRRQQTIDAAGSREEDTRRGLRECEQHGTVAVGEIATGGWPETAFEEAPIASTVFLELIGRDPALFESLFGQLESHLAAGARPNSAFSPGISPHAPYSVSPSLVTRACELSQRHRAPVAMHLAESIEELELLSSSSGPFRQLLEDLGAWDSSAIPRGIAPIDYLEMLAAAHRALVIHGNFLTRDEIRFIGERRDRMSIAFCPRTHDYFQHGRYPLGEMLDQGVNVAIGTDSRASNPDLNVFEELRAIVKNYSAIPLEQVLRLGTLAGAMALGIDQTFGSLEAGKRAALACVKLSDSNDASEPHELLFHSHGEDVTRLALE